MSSRSVAASELGSVNSVVAGVVRESSVTFLALDRLLSSTRALVFVSTTLVASAPAPATPKPPASPNPAAMAMPVDETRMEAFSRAVRVMSPDVLLTRASPFGARLFVIEASTELVTVLRAMLAPIDRVPPAKALGEVAAIVTAATSVSIVEVSVAARMTSDPVIPSPAAWSMEAATPIPTSLIAWRPEPANPPPTVDSPANATAPARTKASTVCSAPAITDTCPVAVTLDSVSVALVLPFTVFFVSATPMATETPTSPPPDLLTDTAATLASMSALFSALSVRSPVVPSVLRSTVAFVSPPISLIAPAPPPVNAMLVCPFAIETDALTQYALIVLCWDASRLMLEGAVAPVATEVIDAPTFAVTVLVALLAAMARATLVSAPVERAIVPPIA